MSPDQQDVVELLKRGFDVHAQVWWKLASWSENTVLWKDGLVKAQCFSMMV